MGFTQTRADLLPAACRNQADHGLCFIWTELNVPVCPVAYIGRRDSLRAPPAISYIVNWENCAFKEAVFGKQM